MLFRFFLLSLGALFFSQCSTFKPTTSSPHAHKLAPERAQQELALLLYESMQTPNQGASARALALFVESWKTHFPSTQELMLEHQDGQGKLHAYQVRMGSCSVYDKNPLQYFTALYSSERIKHKSLKNHAREGYGGTLVGELNQAALSRDPLKSYYPPEGVLRPLTAIVSTPSVKTSKANKALQVRVNLFCPLSQDRVRIQEQSLPLAANFSAPWAELIERSRSLQRTKFTDLLTKTPQRAPQLYLMQPYHPDKQPLILIHGLFDSPLVWADLSNELWADPEIHRKYQIWHYLYNTSAPALYSGRILSNQLRALRAQLDPDGNDLAMQSTTIIAHSMGGLVTRRLITEPKLRFWDAAFTRPIEELKLSEPDRAALRRAFLWQPETHVKRVVYLAVPHQGSNFADNPLGRFGRWLVKPPSSFSSFYQRIRRDNPDVFTELYSQIGQGELDSIHALSPKQPTLQILSQMPNSHPVEEYSIIGRTNEKISAQNSTDGIVDYWSSHIPRAKKEYLIKSGHQIVENEEAVGVIKQILKQ